MKEKEELDLVLEMLRLKGYTLDFNPEKTNGAAWGVMAAWPAEIDYDIDETIDCYCLNETEKLELTVFAVTTKQFGLKGVIICNTLQEKYLTIGEILDKFRNLFSELVIFFRKQRYCWHQTAKRD
ncbi:hypothetical protein [Pedobacter aquatilis]|uniref:hypothetical protein n=1 Tax=Pedobacter aquatilis TaxID=351343 RepID=UPI00292E3D06|nr:hypothetical protein [Pedobacter aquatilis]